MSEVITYTLQIDKDKTGARADKVLAEVLDGVSRARLQKLIREGHVLRDGEVTMDVSSKVHVGEIWVVSVPAPKPACPEPRAIPFEVVFEDQHLIVVEKPAGMVVHPAAGHEDDTLVNALLHHCSGSLSGIGGVMRPGIVHRLDKDTSGLLVAAKNDATHQGLASQFSAHCVRRKYLAVVWGCPKSKKATIQGLIGRSPKNRKKMAVLKRDGKFARTHYNVLDTTDDVISLLECRLETGRTHQIRVHMASIGHSIVGDLVYGRHRKISPLVDSKVALRLGSIKRQLLHAKTLGFTHPITQRPLEFYSDKVLEIEELFPSFENH